MTSFYGGGAASTSGGGSTPTPIKGALIFKGTLGISDDGATVLVLPDEHEEGWTYLVVTAGTYAGQLCEKGDFIICVSSGEAASNLDWTVVQGNTFNTLPTPTALDEGKIISVDTSGNYVLIDNPSSGETENLPDPSEADEGKILSVGADGNYILTDNPAEDKLDKANPTYTGSLTGENATFTGSVQVSTPDQDNEAANKSYVDTALADAKNYTDSEITNLENGTTELPYVKDSGDTVTGTYNFTGANVTIAEPTVSNNPATKNYVDTKIASAGGSGEVVSYTQGNGINISSENVISVVIAADNANGLAVDTNGIKLNVATPTTAGAMSGTDKAKLDATSTTEQMNQAISNAIDETLEDPTKLPFVNINGDTMHGSLTTTELFTDFVTIRNAGTDGNTGFQNNSDTDHIRVYDKIADTLVPIEVGEPVNNQDASTKKYVDDKVTTETAARIEAIESLDEAKADKDNPTFTGIISGANATLSGTLTGNTATFSGGVTVPLEPGAEGSATSKKYVDDQIAAIDIGPLTQRVATAEGEIDTLQSDIINITNGTTELPYIPSDGGTISGPINWGGSPQEATELANKAYVDANDSDAVNSAKEYTNAQIEIAKGYTDEAVTNLTNGTTKLPYVTKEEVEIAADTRDVARAYRYTFNDGLDGTNSNAGFGFIDFTPAIVTEKDGSTSFSPLYIGEPEKDSHAATKKYVDDKAGNYLPLAGGTMTGSINAGENTVTNLKEPEEGTDATTKNYVDGEIAKAVIQETNDKIDAVYNSLVKKAETVDEVNQLFKDWWNANWEEGSSTYNDMLERWFGKVLDDDKVYGVKLPLFETSTSPQGEYIEDSVGAIVTPATEEDPGQNDFAKTPQFWCVEVAAEKNADGSHTIYACEFIDDINVVRNGGPDNGKHLVWVLQKNTYVREYEESGYSYIKIQCHPADGFVQWPQGTDRTGHTYSYMANPKYAAGIDDEGNIGGRTGLRPTSYMSMNQTIQAWRARGPQYSGSSACFYKWAYIMFALLTAKKGEDVGCNRYNLQYAAAVSESGVSRIILTADQANNLYVGSNVIVGDTEGNNERGQAAMYSLVNQKRISSIEEVTIEEDASSYKAVYIDVPEGTTFNTTARTTYISTMPYYSGWTDTVKGTIGTRYGTNLNKQPYLLQKVELMNGAYNYASDELDQWSQQDDTHYLYNYYLCEDQTKVSTKGTITDDYVKKENATITIDTSVYTNYRWYYIEDNLADNNFKMLNPKKISTSAGSGIGTRDAFYLRYEASAVRVPMVWASLWLGGHAGLSCRDSNCSPSWLAWDYAGGCPGLSG